MVKVCSICGKTFETNVSGKKTCSEECAAISKKRYNDAKNARARVATRERIGIKICATCGKEFSANHPAKVCCSPDCQRVRERELAKASWKKEALREKKIKSSEKAIIDINAKAKAMGLSYGQYVARYGG